MAIVIPDMPWMMPESGDAPFTDEEKLKILAGLGILPAEAAAAIASYINFTVLSRNMGFQTLARDKDFQTISAQWDFQAIGRG
jgi:hypothetical protein